VCLDESVLYDIERVVSLAHHAHREGIGAPVIALEQSAKRLVVPGAGTVDQLEVVDVIRRLIRPDRRVFEALIHVRVLEHITRRPSTGAAAVLATTC
jgi:hypothetical protein